MIPKTLIALASVCLMCCIATVCQAELSTNDFTISISTEIHNNNAEQNIDTIIKNGKFVLLNEDNNASTGNPWIKISWNKHKITDEQYLINDFTSQAHEDYYLIKNDNVLAHYKSGYTNRFDERPIEHFKFVTNISGADYVLAKTCCNPTVPMYFRMLNAEELTQQYYQDLIWYAVIYALIAMMIVYNFFIFLYLREKQYLYYCYYLLSMLFILLTLSGLGKQFIWPNITKSETLYFISGLNVSIASMLFLLAFLNPKYLTKLNKRLMQIIIGLHFVVLVFYLAGSFVEGTERIANLLVQVVSITGWFITDYVIIRNLIAGDRTAKILLLSYMLINIAGAIFIMHYNGYLTEHRWAEHIVDMAVLAESLILSLALAQKIQRLRDEKSQAEEQQLSAQKRFSRQLLEMQEEEKKQLGSALHDNFTHQLLILKTKIIQTFGVKSDTTQHVEKILNDMRGLSHIIHPYLLEKLGLKDAIADMIDKISRTYELDMSFACDDIYISTQQQLIIYRIVQESLNNIVKHSEANECVIAITRHNQYIDILIKDDGLGFDVNNKKGLGLTMIQERCNILKGHLNITSDMTGSRLHIHFPYTEVKVTKHIPTDVNKWTESK